MRRPEVTEFSTRDPARARAHITSSYADQGVRILGAPDAFEYRHRRIDMGGVRIDYFHNTPTVEYDVERPGHVIVVRVVEGWFENVTDGVMRRLGPGQVALVARPLDRYVTRMEGSVEAVGVDERIFARVEPRSVERLAHLRLEPVDAASGHAWQQTIDYVTRMTADDVAAESPLVLGQAGRLVAATVLALFDPHQAADGLDATPDTLRRAIDFIEANPGTDIGVADVAEACHVTVRALQLAFRRHLGTTPMGYLRRVRLDRVYAELRESDPTTGATVTAAAARWGFTQLGRFSAQYRETFGEAPRDTLRRR